MRTISAFNSITIDGYFTDQNGDISWAHAAADPEFDRYVKDNASGDSTLLFGRKTYDMMVAYWPTPAAKTQQPEVAEGMNRRHKIVFSRSLKDASWENTTVLNGDPVTEVRKLREQDGTDMTILGSGSLVAPLVRAGLVDTLTIVIVPVVLGNGRTMFENVAAKFRFETSRTFQSGRVVLNYKRA